jgi:hypothetical protein
MSGVRIAMVLLLAACETNPQPSSRASRQPAAELTGHLPRHMANCPSAVPTAHTIALPTANGVDVIITSDDARARAQILARTELQRGMGEPLIFLPQHTGTHAGPGTMGRCPIIHNGTDVEFAATAGGVIVHVTARDRTQVEQLQRATAARLAALQWPSS